MGILDGLMSGSFLGPAVSGVLGFLGQQDTNEENRQIAQDNSAFNAAEAEKTRAFNAEMWEENRAANAWEAEYARNYSTNMANTAYQRAVTDIKAAGLNPMLAYMKGGADTPNAAMASTSSAQGAQATAAPAIPMQNKTAAAAQATQAAMSTAAQAADIERQQAEADRTRAEAARTRQETYMRSFEASNAEEWTRTRLEALQQSIKESGTRQGLNDAQAQTAGIHASLMTEQTKLTEANAKKVSYEINRIIADTGLTNAQIRKVYADTANAIREGRKIDAQTGNITADTRLKELDIDGLAGAESRYYQTAFGGASLGLKDAFSLINSAAGARAAFNRGGAWRTTTIDSGTGVRTQHTRPE